MNRPHITRLFGFSGYMKNHYVDLNYWKIDNWYCRKFKDACQIASDIQRGIDIREKYPRIVIINPCIGITIS